MQSSCVTTTGLGQVTARWQFERQLLLLLPTVLLPCASHLLSARGRGMLQQEDKVEAAVGRLLVLGKNALLSASDLHPQHASMLPGIHLLPVYRKHLPRCCSWQASCSASRAPHRQRQQQQQQHRQGHHQAPRSATAAAGATAVVRRQHRWWHVLQHSCSCCFHCCQQARVQSTGGGGCCW